jgi:hypothetical protein
LSIGWPAAGQRQGRQQGEHPARNHQLTGVCSHNLPSKKMPTRGVASRHGKVKALFRQLNTCRARPRDRAPASYLPSAFPR